MTRLNVNPTRMELTNLKRRRITAVRGHKLLKDKQDELMRHFIEMIRENHDVRQQVEVELSRVYKSMAASRGDLSSTFVEGALMLPDKTPEVDLKLHNIMSVKLPVYRVLTSGSQSPEKWIRIQQDAFSGCRAHGGSV
jgi:V/A-type H+/Na+-transporting ATPase subunit D